jgi:hypothetical protein
LPSSSGKHKLCDDNSSKQNSTSKKLKLEVKSNQVGDIIEYIPDKVKPVVIALDDGCDSGSFQVKNPVMISSVTFTKTVHHKTRSNKDTEPREVKVSIEEIELQRKKRPKITYFKLISDAFVESNKIWLNCEQVCKRITQKHAYFRGIDIKILKKSVHPMLSRKNLFNKYKPVKQFKMYSLIKSANPLAITSSNNSTQLSTNPLAIIAPEITPSFKVEFKIEMSKN